MKKLNYLKNVTFIIILIVISLLISSCDSSIQERTIFKGTTGLNIEFIESVPDSVYEGTKFFIGARINNLGPYTIIDENPAVVSLVTDETYFVYDKTQFKDINKFSILGKSIYYPEGDLLIMALPDIQTKNMTGAIQNPESGIYLSVCYPYKTIFSEPMCIDFDLYGQDQREKVCVSGELTFSGGQGSPIVVTKITPLMQSSSRGVKPNFIIEIQNKDNGIPWYNKNKNCLSGGYKTEDWNKIKINGSLSTFNLKCEPEVVRLIDNKGTIKCYSEGEFEKSTNFLTVLNLNLDFNYIESTSKNIEIMRMPEGDIPYYTIPGVTSCQGKPEGSFCHNQYVMVCNENGECEDKCSYCARADGNRPNVDCKGIRKGFACSCSATDIIGIPLSKDEYENAACRIGLCCNPGLTEFKVQYSERINNQFSQYKDLPENNIFDDSTTYRFKPYTTSDTTFYCMLSMFDENGMLIFNTPIDVCENENFIEVDPYTYRGKSLTFITYAFEKKDSNIEDYKFKSNPYSIKFVPYRESYEILVEKIKQISKDDSYFTNLQPNYCAAFIKRLLRKAYGLGVSDELSTIGLNCLDSQVNGKSNDAWDIAACFISQGKVVYDEANEPFFDTIDKIARSGDLIFALSDKSWCKWSGYNYYKFLETNIDNKDYCNNNDPYRYPKNSGFCTKDSIVNFTSITLKPDYCDYSEDGRTINDFPMITHIGIYLGDNKAAYYNNQLKIEQGTVYDFFNSINGDGIRLIIRPNYPELNLD